MRVAWQSRFHRILDNRHFTPEGELFRGTAEPASPGRQCRPLGGDAAGGAGGYINKCSPAFSPPRIT